MSQAVVNQDQGLTREELVRIWAHEALRLFSDRLVGKSTVALITYTSCQQSQKLKPTLVQLMLARTR